jgi:DNA invertase Pin-like site-specific DNA recombinase
MDKDVARRAAYSYLRFSSPEQAKGDSFRRQFELAGRYAEANNLDLDESLSFHDLGVSAYRGTNSETGQLGVLLEAVKTGLIPRGAIILVESLDRISRQSARKALRIIESIVELGVSIVTLVDGREYTLESLDRDPINLLMAILTFIRANEESTIKSQRVAAAWEAKRKRAPSVLITSRCPGWMQVSPDKSSFILIPDRVQTIQDIFRMALSGGTLCGIARSLNNERVPPLRSQGVQGKFWTTSSIKMLLQGENVLGTLEPFTCRLIDGKLTRKPLPLIKNYYPRLISDEVFEAVQAELLRRREKSRVSHKRATQNLIGFITRCGYCGSGMVKAYGTTGGYLVCRNRFLHAGCPSESINYGEVEKAFLVIIRARISSDPPPKDRSLRVWSMQMLRALNEYSTEKSEVNRIIRKQCVAVRVYHDTGRMEVTWKSGDQSTDDHAFTPSFDKSVRSRIKARKRAEIVASTNRAG